MNFRRALTMEEKLVLLLSQPYLSEKQFKAKVNFLNLLNDRIDFNRVNKLASENGVSGLIYTKIKNDDFFPSAVKDELQRFYRQTAYKNMQQLRDTLAVVRLLSDQGISVIPLKGAVFSDLIFNDLGAYPSGDIDILVHPDQLAHAQKVICEKGGYSEIKSIAKEDLLATHYHLNFTNNKNLLEVHWNLVKRYFDVPADFWWCETLGKTWNGINLIEISTEKYILYTVFRLFDHCFRPLRFFVLIGGLIEKDSNAIDWHKLIAYAKQYKMKKLVVFSLKLLHEMLDTDIPESIIKEQPFAYRYLRTMVISGLFKGVKRSHIRMMVYSLLLDDPVKIIGVLLGRIFPSKAEVRLRYNVPPNSWKVYLYLILNPFFLFFYNKSH